MFDRDYQAGRAELHDGLDRLLARIVKGAGVTFDAIHRAQWSAPWKTKARKKPAGIA
jgi:hypothetical protein